MAENKTAEHTTLEDIEARVPNSLHPVIEAAFKHSRQILAGVVAIILVAAAYAAYSGYTARALANAQTQLGTIVIEAAGQDKIDRLEALLDSAPTTARPAVFLELAQSAMNLAQYEAAAGYWGSLAAEADNEMRLIARMGHAKCLLLAGRAKEAVAELKDLAGIAPADFTAPVYRQLAVAAEAAGDTPQALEAYRKLAEQQVTDKPFIDHKIAQLEAK
ncbi:MAG: bacterial transcriptional activator domain-containing protein [Pseudodesulfovibrio sp.]|uniref:Transcriptional activator domain protein n=1 Tax=Pseudodesulfovibrio aespoeensis (strain ATCC 700646 / DSM 10631 / Aspo-2) TaxID=643562 RepID=E6VTS0_PSEA9|nr:MULTISPECIES: bacterial transcriptional activator domain-containing protein [Pseudodesulfovibrio]MBU4190948.1 bacterial transcriptional activator domain-containing protein [Pseudomonadota bacterium]ADU63357.1 transcriptional activator domain protein [Pseudodesulfovibrio aespoeensis Aspo-2]MBU4245209.1 bacterial transcriptional activator domain-containing protein [Pseudomonadota bacterium]MBU4379623.1 bacterial transcriptional activator domain-containing protein [Pseudomonadota bacterium]MBU